MAREIIELDPVEHITIDAIGKPGERVFYVQAVKGPQVITLLIEKIQVQTLSLGIEEMLEQIAQQHPDLPAASTDFTESAMHILPPVDPLFRVGEAGIAFDLERDQVCLVLRQVIMESQSEDDTAEARFWASRSQIMALARWSIEITNRGRQICPQCGEPIDPAGHLCPKKNGHKH